MSDKKKAFALSSGLPWADTEVTITSAQFGYTDMGGKDPVLCLILTGFNGDGDEGEQSFSVGSGWEAVDSGKRLQAENGKADKPFSKQSNIGKLIASAIVAVGGDPDDMPFDDPTVAAEWVGHVWRTGTRSEPKKSMGGKAVIDPETGEPAMRDRIVFEEYIGPAEGASDKPAAKASSSSSSSDKGKASKPADDDDNETIVKLTELAKECDDFEDFEEKALDVPGVENDASLVKRVMNRKADGFYQSARKD